MRLDAKAWENLDAAEHLLATKTHDMFPNASASRAYYAAYLAVANRLLSLGVAFGSSGYFKHDELPSDARQYGVLTDDESDDLIVLRDRRVKADYFEDNVDLEEANQAHQIARELVQGLLAEETA
jgi:uncharacterized protein (UPF0332 family)